MYDKQSSTQAKRSYLSSVYQKIYLGDICARNKISNPNLLRLMIKKMAESVKQPLLPLQNVKQIACKRRVIITYDEEKAIEDEYGIIEVIPCWKWLLQQ